MAFGSKTTLASEKAAKAAIDSAPDATSISNDNPPTKPLTEESAAELGKLMQPMPEGAPAPVVEAPTVPAITPEQQFKIDQILANARKAAETVLLGHPSDTLGTPSRDIEDKTEAVQRDRVPGTRRKDKTYIPEFIYDEELAVLGQNPDRRVLLHSEYRYMLVDGETIDNYFLNGYKMCLFDGGSRSGLTERGFRGTGDNVFRRDTYGRCQRGDCFLMYIPIRGWNELAQEDRARIEGAVPAALGSFANAAYGVGIRPFIEAEGKSLT